MLPRNPTSKGCTWGGPREALYYWTPWLSTRLYTPVCPAYCIFCIQTTIWRTARNQWVINSLPLNIVTSDDNKNICFNLYSISFFNRRKDIKRKTSIKIQYICLEYQISKWYNTIILHCFCFFHRRMRYIGYRQLARWCWGWLGKRVRVPLPACATHNIRTTYPEENGQYRGFSYAWT